MLELKIITKDYPIGDGKVSALRGIDLKFRSSEFVSILGPSGCGKTTMLNIIGGLDQYTSGDLIINGRSTKDFKDRDWDSYRNHSVGFVFQSYNLIPHQTVLQNVELALTLSGVSKAERRRRAIKALEDVGLGDQKNKKPSEMSGGQMQRVAIARAIVNNPDIILADEPTGALDTETSIQVMNILKEISKDRLIIMVTHNPELAETYSTRIIRMLDGAITDDSQPLTDEETEAELAKAREKVAKQGKQKLPSMSPITSFGLSLKNLFTKKGRTILTAFAGSIGIIGIALILSVSQGTTNFIDSVQEDTLASYPLTIEEEHANLGSLMEMFINSAEASGNHDQDAVYQKPALYDLVNSLNSIETDTNDLKSFKAFIEAERNDPDSEYNLSSALSGVQYTYNTDLLVYTKNVDGEIIVSDLNTLIGNLMAKRMGMEFAQGMSAATGSNSMMSTMMSSGVQLWQEMLPGDNGRLVSKMLEEQYDVVYGSWPTEFDEVVLVLDSNNELSDMTLYALGLKSEGDIEAIMEAAENGTTVEVVSESWTYEEICNMEFRVILSSECYKHDEKAGVYTDLRSTSAGLKYLYDNGLTLKVSGIIRPNGEAVSSMLTGSIGYTEELTKYIIEASKSSDAITAQLADPTTDIFTGLHFKPESGQMTDEQKALEFRMYISTLSTSDMADAFVKIKSIPSVEELEAAVQGAMANVTREQIEMMMLQELVKETGMDEGEISEYISSMTDEDLMSLYESGVVEMYTAKYVAGIEAMYSVYTDEQLAEELTKELTTYTTEQCALYHDEVLLFSDSTYEDNLRVLGYVDLDSPATINLFASSFADKEIIEKAIEKYNSTVDEVSQISYTDYVGIMMSSITIILDAITYVLIAFVAVSLIVSAIMIGVITLISVQERTKEIGILRAIGASKKNVSGLFNAETVIIGFTAGLLGVIITYLLCIPIDMILMHLTGLANLRTNLPINAAIILVIISVVLTLIAGIIPSRSAAKKDPVVALRTE
ncbi:MAG: ABC transporter ATP-binding protein/permease [Ruminococcaceae bacterium]|nr:ABC transporter ATP-binding protein/permease [Oscillospiraceae bacterium]